MLRSRRTTPINSTTAAAAAAAAAAVLRVLLGHQPLNHPPTKQLAVTVYTRHPFAYSQFFPPTVGFLSWNDNQRQIEKKYSRSLLRPDLRRSAFLGAKVGFCPHLFAFAPRTDPTDHDLSIL